MSQRDRESADRIARTWEARRQRLRDYQASVTGQLCGVARRVGGLLYRCDRPHGHTGDHSCFDFHFRRED